MGSKSIQYFAAAGKNLWPHLVISLRPFWHVYDPICSTLEDDDHPSCLSFFPFISTGTEVLFLDNSKVFVFSAGEANLSCKMRPFSVIYQHSDYPYYSVTTFPLLWLLVKATMFARRCQSFLKAFGTINSTAKMIIELVKKALLSLLIWSRWLFFPMKWF